MLRTIALGRKNYLFVGNEGAGKNLAMLTSIVATCVLYDTNPEFYIKDILLRVQSHPASKLEELLPHRWKRGQRRALQVEEGAVHDPPRARLRGVSHEVIEVLEGSAAPGGGRTAACDG